MQSRSTSCMRRLAALGAGAILALGSGALLAQAARPSAAAIAAEHEALVKAAKAEGEITFYISAIETIARRILAGFEAKYGIKGQFVRMNGSTLLFQRYSSEAEAGNIAADLAFAAGGADTFSEQAVTKGWLDPVKTWNLPVLNSGEFPARLNRNWSVVVQISPWQVGYNTNKVNSNEVPKDWAEFADPKWKGQLILPNPGVSDAYPLFWAAMQDRYGDAFLTRIAANARPAAGGVAAAQSLAAGEGSFVIPVIVSTIESIKSKGGPLGIHLYDYTAGVDMQMMLTARGKAKRPNASRLFANYVMSPEGNKVMNDEPGGFSVYDSAKLPKEYQSEKPGTVARKAVLTKLLGF